VKLLSVRRLALTLELTGTYRVRRAPLDRR